VVRRLLDFPGPEAILGWRPVDDVVMGGCSHSRISWHDEALVFSGELSLARGGGFASIRSPRLDLDLSDASALLLTVRGDGQRYKVGLRVQEAFDAPVYQALIHPPAGERVELIIPYAELEAHYHGRRLEAAPPFDPRRVCSIGLLIAGRQTGPFRLELRSVAAC